MSYKSLPESLLVTGSTLKISSIADRESVLELGSGKGAVGRATPNLTGASSELAVSHNSSIDM